MSYTKSNISSPTSGPFRDIYCKLQFFIFNTKIKFESTLAISEMSTFWKTFFRATPERVFTSLTVAFTAIISVYNLKFRNIHKWSHPSNGSEGGHTETSIYYLTTAKPSSLEILTQSKLMTPITRGEHCKFNFITVAFQRTWHNIYDTLNLLIC